MKLLITGGADVIVNFAVGAHVDRSILDPLSFARRDINGKTVLHLITGLGIGGAEKQLLLTVRYLPPQFHSIVVCLKDETLLLEKFKESGINAINLKTGGLNFIRGIFSVRRIIINKKVALVHTHLARADIVGWLATIGLNIPVISTRHNTYEPWEKNILLKFLYRMAMLKMKRILTVSSSVRDYLVQWLKVPREKITIIHNGIEVSKMEGTVPDEGLAHLRDEVRRMCLSPRRISTVPGSIKKELGIKDGEFVIGTVSRLDPVKGHRYLLHALPLVLKEIPSLRLLIVGDGPERQRLEKLVSELGMKEKVIFTGYREDIPEILSILDVFVQPSLKEGFGVSILEAIAAGKPVVAANIDGISELAEECKGLILVPPGDAEQLAFEIIRLLNDNALRSQMSNADISKFDIQKKVKELESVYSYLLS